VSYTDVVICVGLLPYLETWPPIYRGPGEDGEGKIESKPSLSPCLLWYAPCLTDFTFEFIRRPTSPILSPLFRTFVELTLVRYFVTYFREQTIVTMHTININQELLMVLSQFVYHWVICIDWLSAYVSIRKNDQNILVMRVSFKIGDDIGVSGMYII
jgi:hypothetical protein